MELCNFFVGNCFITKKKQFDTGSSKQFSKSKFVMEEVVMEEKLYKNRYHWSKRRIKLATFCALSIKTFFKVMSRRWCLGCCVFNARTAKQNLCTSIAVNSQRDDKDACQQLATSYLYLLVWSSFKKSIDSD